MTLLIRTRIAGDTVVLDLSGRLWVLDLPLRDQVHALLAQGCRFFILNIEEVNYIDSSGLGQLVSIWTSVRTQGGNVVLLRPTERVRRLLFITKLQMVFDVFLEEEKAALGVRRRLFSNLRAQLTGRVRQVGPPLPGRQISLTIEFGYLAARTPSMRDRVTGFPSTITTFQAQPSGRCSKGNVFRIQLRRRVPLPPVQRLEHRDWK